MNSKPILCLLFCLLSNLAYAESKAVVPQTVFDFGAVNAGSKVEREFEIANQGDKPLYIRKVNSSCGCTAAVVSSNVINAGEQTTLKIAFDTSGFKGYKVKTIRVYTSDPKMASIVFTFKGTVQPEVEIVPNSLNFGNVIKGEKQTLQVIVRSKNPDFKIKAVKTNASKLTVGMSEVAGSPKDGEFQDLARLEVTLRDDLELGGHRTQVVLKTNNKRLPVIHIPVFAQVKGDLVLSEPSVSFGLIESLEIPLEKEIILTNRGQNKILKVLSVSCDHPDVEVDFKELEPGVKFAVSVRVLGGWKGSLRTRVKIETDHLDPEQKDLYLPVFGIKS